MQLRRATLLAGVLAFQGCMCTWGQGDYGKGCDTGLASDDAAPGSDCSSRGGVCVSADNACPPAQQILSDCNICCLPAWDASSDATDEELEAGLDARSDADASVRDGSADAPMTEAGDGQSDASGLDATPDDAADTGSEPSED